MKNFKGRKSITNYNGLYSVSEYGEVLSHRVWNGKKNRVLKQHANSFGYPTVTLTKNGRRKKVFIHKLVAHHFLGEKPKGLQIRHLDGNKMNNHFTNLAYGTSKENAEDRRVHNRTASGSRIGTSKLSEHEVVEIRSAYKKRGDMVKLAKKYNVSCANIYYIITNKSRRNG